MSSPQQAPPRLQPTTPQRNNSSHVVRDHLKSDQRLAAGWTARDEDSETLQQAGASGPQHDAVYANAIKAANNFLADNNYSTTAVAVLVLLKSPF